MKTTGKIIATTLAASILLSGCVQTLSSRDRATMTPQEIALREEADTFNRTVGEGIATGCVAGGAIGAGIGAAQRQNPLVGFLIGCIAGGAAGGFTGWYIADKQQQYANEEQRLDAMIVDVKSDNERLVSLIDTSRTVIAQDQAKIDALEKQLAAGTITKDQARRELAAVDDNTSYLQETLKSLEERKAGYVEARKQTTGSDDQLAAMDAEIANLEKQIGTLKQDVDGLVQRRTISRIG